MSKIILSIEHGLRLREVWLVKKTHHEALEAVANELVNMGLVRPATDDLATLTETVSTMMDTNDAIMETNRNLAARVAALEVQRGLQANQIADLQERMQTVEESIPDHPLMDRVAALESHVRGVDEAVAALEAKSNYSITSNSCPDPHAAAKERAKLWGARLIRCKDKWFIFVTDFAFTASGWSERKDSLGKSDAVVAVEFTGQWSSEAEAWSNFPTVPPPGWEAAKPRTEADRLERLAEVAKDAWYEEATSGPEGWRRIAHAVRKADRAAQLEPSEEEVDAVSGHPDVQMNQMFIRRILIAAARVRLEKAEGER